MNGHGKIGWYASAINRLLKTQFFLIVGMEADV